MKIGNLLNPFDTHLNFKSNGHILVALFLISLMYGLYVAERLHRYPTPILTVDDISGYISESLFIKENGGILNFITSCINGEYPLANRQPLFLLLLSIFAERSLNFLVVARVCTMATGLLFVIVFFFISYKLFNGLTSLLATFFLLRNMPFIQSSLSVNVEPLLMTTVIIFLFYSRRSLEDKRLQLPVGIISGISYMLKLSGILLVGIHSIYYIIYNRIKKQEIKNLLPFFLGFLFIVSPLIIRNIVVFKTPFYDENTSMIWVDTTSEFLSLEANENPPTLSRYFNNRTISHFLKRTLDGMAGYFNVFIRETLAVSVFEEKVPQIKKLSGIVLFIMMLAGIFLSRDRKLNVLMLLSIIVFFIPVTLTYQVIKPTRYLLPVFPFAILYAANGIVKSLQLMERRLVKISDRFSVIKMMAILLSILYIIYPSKMFASVYGENIQMIHVLPGYYELADWASENIEEGDVYFGPLVVYHFELFTEELKEKNLTYPYIVAKYFLDKPKKGRYPIPLTNDINKLNEYMRKHNAKYIIISGLEIQAYENVLKEYFSFDFLSGMRQIKPIGNWDLVFQSPKKSPAIKVFQLKNHERY